MTPSTPTRGQVERTLVQRVQALYRERLGHQPSKITCQLSDQNVVLVLEGSTTQPEQLLAQSGRLELAEQVHSDLDDAIQPQLKTLIEETLNVSVIELLSDATLASGRTGIIALLTNAPEVRTPDPTSKIKRKLSSTSEKNPERTAS
ncbi:hypothetical protein WA1_01620 [Scytonema hofmannii PCC 7110]|uniref:Na+-translocating membrane potential-generating system MpsC domain-containing protein n=1 Tax=Scytonema hofmannii PCC 7110 TaxID=128403 RepID=A0A139XGQ0_9CYAN|nr:DUF2294 domain-containing protein [Scytonema hofmannii]KYC43875.1 hypothetical protein WA1_01620 [Scytonema hofmannii PCC 7110]